MEKSSTFKFYIMEMCGIISLLSLLLPWISYGIGSKTGVDIGRTSIHVLLISGSLFILFSYFSYKTNKWKKAFLYFTLIASSGMFFTFLFELIRIAYQTSMTKNLPVEMFGVASLATSKIHVGYGLWLGTAASLIPSLLNLVAIKMRKN